MSSSTSTNSIRKNSDFVDTLSKLSKQSNEYSEMNSINSTILLNPAAIKNNFPVINQLYQPIFSQRQDTIDTTNINSISNTINPLFLATSFQTLQNSKINFHPYYRNNSSQINGSSSKNNRNSNQISKLNQAFLNNFQTNSLNQPINLYNVNTNSILPYNYNLVNKTEFNPQIPNTNYNIKLSDETIYNCDKTKSCSNQIIISQQNNNFTLKNDNSRLSNDCSNNWLINNQIKNQMNNSSNVNLSIKTNQAKRRLSGKNFTYSDKNAVDSVKKLDKIILNHNKNLQEIIKHKNQLIKTITSNQLTTNRNSKESYMQILNSQPSYSTNRSLNKVSNFIQVDTSNKNKNNQSSFTSLNNSLLNSSNPKYNQTKSSNNSFLNTSTNINYKNVVNGNKNFKKNINDQTKDLFDSANSLNAITKAMNEEAELNKQKLIQSKKIVKKTDCIIQKPVNKPNLVKKNNTVSIAKTNEKKIIEDNKVLISKLDERENRLKLKRKKEELNNESTNSIYNSLEIFYNENYDNDCFIDELDEEISDVEYNDEYAYRLKYNSIIMQAPRVPLKLNQNKLNYFENLGLTTADSKAEIDFEKFVRTKKILKEISIEKENEENTSENKKTKIIKKSNQVLSPSKISPDDLKNENSNTKLSFFNVLGLKEQKNSEEKKLKELFWEGVLEDRERRRIFNLCFEKSLDNLDPETKENWLKNLENENNLKNDIQLNIISNNNNRIPSSDGLLTTVSQLKAIEELTNVNCLTYSEDNNEQIDKEENLLEEIQSSNNQSKFKWPGINVILKSYSEFSNAKSLEKKNLLEKVKKLNQLYNKKTKESESLKLKLSFLIQADKDLNEDHDKLKLLISNLKYNLSQF